jgi:Mg2+ and Co2+ transporter CorA
VIDLSPDEGNNDTNRESTAQADFSKQFYKQFLYEISATLWTINDQRKLKALRDLRNRRLEYHNNIHTKDGKLELHVLSEVDEVEDHVIQSAIVMAYAIHFYAIEGVSDGHQHSALHGNYLSSLKVHTLTYGQLDSFCMAVREKLSFGESSTGTGLATNKQPFQGKTIPLRRKSKYSQSRGQGFTWLHLKDLLALETIAKHFKIHELAVNGFKDLRTHSSLLPIAEGECVITLVACGMDGNDFNMYKLYIYISASLVITFQAELLPDINDMELAASERLVQPILDNFMKIRKKCLELGPAYLFYELALQILRVWDTSLEFISYSLSYFRKIVGLKLLHREKLETMIKMNVVSSAASMFQSELDEVRIVLQLLLSALMDVDNTCTSTTPRNNNSSKSEHSHGVIGSEDFRKTMSDGNSHGYRRYLVPLILQDDLHMPYFMDLSDSCQFTDNCLENIIADLNRVNDELDLAMHLRTTNLSIILSLVTTIFWPSTFLSTVFGMNFVVNGGSSLDLLNKDYGVDIFAVICVGKYVKIYYFKFIPDVLFIHIIVCAVCTMTVFIYKGWVELDFLFRPLRRLKRGTQARIDDSKSSQLHLAEERAMFEEKRRQEETLRRRSFGKAARNVEVFHQKQSIAVGAPKTPSRSSHSFSGRFG